MSLRRTAGLPTLAVVFGLGGYFILAGFYNDGDEGASTVAGPPIVTVRVPEFLSERAQVGRVAFDYNCASCHGRNAAGQDEVAPPLVHVIYEPGHHGDESFQRAVALGVPAHHWHFGDMAPVEGLSRSDVAGIVAYIRELQRANGIN